MVYLYRIRNSGGKNVFTILKLVFREVLNLIMVKSYISLDSPHPPLSSRTRRPPLIVLIAFALPCPCLPMCVQWSSVVGEARAGGWPCAPLRICGPVCSDLGFGVPSSSALPMFTLLLAFSGSFGFLVCLCSTYFPLTPRGILLFWFVVIWYWRLRTQIRVQLRRSVTSSICVLGFICSNLLYGDLADPFNLLLYFLWSTHDYTRWFTAAATYAGCKVQRGVDFHLIPLAPLWRSCLPCLCLH